MINHASELLEVSQEFIDAISRHNGRNAPREPAQKLRRKPLTPAVQRGLRKIAALLARLEPDLGYEDWVRVLMAIYHETGGSEAGFELANSWSSGGSKYKGEQDIRAKWNSFRDDTQQPITIGTLIQMVKLKGIDAVKILADLEPNFKVCNFERIEPTPVQPAVANEASNPLRKFSLQGRSAQLRAQVTQQVLILAAIALKGQATVFYGGPNAGKSLLTIAMGIEGIEQNRIDPSNFYYVNVDDTGTGLAEKVELAEEYGFHMISDGHQGFTLKLFLSLLWELIESDQAMGIIIVLDTLKKFANLMDKQKSSQFAQMVRKFVLKGGTLIALAHTNKNPGRNGKRVYAGTTDIIDDFDCAYILDEVSIDEDAKTKVVAFENVKRRGNVARQAAYSYSVEDGISYNDLLMSVEPIDDMQLLAVKQAETLKSDAEIIDAITACIQAGVNTKMKLAKAVAQETGVSRRIALEKLEQYTGNDPSIHRWSVTVGDRGANIYRLLETDTTDDEKRQATVTSLEGSNDE